MGGLGGQEGDERKRTNPTSFQHQDSAQTKLDPIHFNLYRAPTGTELIQRNFVFQRLYLAASLRVIQKFSGLQKISSHYLRFKNCDTLVVGLVTDSDESPKFYSHNKQDV